MNSAEKRGIESRIGRGRNKRARKKKDIQRENEQVGDDQPGGDTLGNFRRTAPPAANAFGEHGRWRHDHRQEIEFSGAHERSDSRGHEQEKRSTEETLGRERGYTRYGCGGGHSNHFILALWRGWAENAARNDNIYV